MTDEVSRRDALEASVLHHLRFSLLREPAQAGARDVYQALARALRDRVVPRWMASKAARRNADAKVVHYLSAEYLLGRSLQANLLNLDLMSEAIEVVKTLGFELDDVVEQEEDPGLGNGGLGRLAACFMDSLATLDLPAWGYGIRYQFGIFHQEIRDGHQVERPDAWLRSGNPWEVPRAEYTAMVGFGGRTEAIEGSEKARKWIPEETVRGVPYDTPMVGFGTQTVNTLRLWRARASEAFDLQVFNDGDYRRAVESKTDSESISKVLYPNDRSPEGRALRLRQQYFFVACSLFDILRRYKLDHEGFEAFPEVVAIHLNDTHPAVAVPELLRILVDLEGLPWDTAWDICQHTFGYTNHTLLPEALETWSLPMFQRLLPRHMELVFDINAWHLRRVQLFAPGDLERVRRMSLIDEGGERRVRMAWLSTVGAHKVNGVAALHTELLRTRLLHDFAEMWPDRIGNKTNGVTPRRWLLQCNPQLSELITGAVGEGWVTDLDRLTGLTAFADDAGFHADLRRIKDENKVALARIIKERTGMRVDPSSMFDVQVKRIHEYKRQLMNCLHVVELYRRLKAGEDVTPRTVIVGGKAAPGYVMAKLHIKLIHDVAALIDADPATRGRLRLVFLPNYNVSLAERIIPATDLSEQISMAGKEASGTGNMKFQMNGALTIGTLDGANVEIREAVGPEHFFLFGLNAAEASRLRSNGYDPAAFAGRSTALTAAIDLVRSGVFCSDEPTRYHQLLGYLLGADPYLICADFDAYAEAHRVVDATWAEPTTWMTSVVHNIANAGRFSSDRTIREYAKEIWDLKPVRVVVDEVAQPAR